MPLTKNLSKSLLMSFRQCPKRLWLEGNHRELTQDSSIAQNNCTARPTVKNIAHKLYDPSNEGITINITPVGNAAGEAGDVSEALRLTQQALTTRTPIFNAGFAHGGVVTFSDVLLPMGETSWRLIEVKSSTEVKPTHMEDIAIQHFVAKGSGLDLHGVSIARVDGAWTYAGNEDYHGLLVEENLTAQVLARYTEVSRWITAAQTVAAQKKEPPTAMGKQCSVPYTCPFAAHCAKDIPKAEFPVAWLPHLQSKKLKQHLQDNNISDMRHIPSNLLTPEQRRVSHVTMHGRTYFDAEEAARALCNHPLPAYFLSFETIHYSVPCWSGTRPFQSIPFQFSVHTLTPHSLIQGGAGQNDLNGAGQDDFAQDGFTQDGSTQGGSTQGGSTQGGMAHTAFLDLTGNDPSEAFATALLKACAENLPVFVYSSFEKTCIEELAERFASLREPLLALTERIVDLLPITKLCYYHKAQYGSWNIKKVLPCMAPQHSYVTLSGEPNGGYAMHDGSSEPDGGYAMSAYAEAVNPHTSTERKAEIEQQLLGYCAQDTQAMTEIWKFLSGVRKA